MQAKVRRLRESCRIPCRLYRTSTKESRETCTLPRFSEAYKGCQQELCITRLRWPIRAARFGCCRKRLGCCPTVVGRCRKLSGCYPTVVGCCRKRLGCCPTVVGCCRKRQVLCFCFQCVGYFQHCLVELSFAGHHQPMQASLASKSAAGNVRS